MSKYYVVRNSDGDTYVTEYSKEQLENNINDKDYWGENVEFLSAIPTNDDTNYWDDKKLIIKGEIVVPKGVVKIAEYKLP